MPSIAVVTDTNASLPADIAERYQIIQVPIMIQFGDQTYTTGIDIHDELLFKMIDAQKKLPTTSAPSPAAFESAYQAAFDRGSEEIICICCSSKVSATFNGAQMAAESFPEGSVTVVDSQTLSLAEGFQVLAAAESSLNGAGKAEILAEIHTIKENSHVYAALPTLKYLAMGGRMGKLAAGLGNTLEIKPILTTQDGELGLLKKVRTWRKAKARLVELALESTGGAPIKRVGIVHVNNESGAMDLFNALREVLAIEGDPLVADFTPGLSVHAGSGVIGFVLIT